MRWLIVAATMLAGLAATHAVVAEPADPSQNARIDRCRAVPIGVDFMDCMLGHSTAPPSAGPVTFVYMLLTCTSYQRPNPLAALAFVCTPGEDKWPSINACWSKALEVASPDGHIDAAYHRVYFPDRSKWLDCKARPNYPVSNSQYYGGRR